MEPTATASLDVDLKVCEARNLYKDYVGMFCTICIVGAQEEQRKVACTVTKWRSFSPQWDDNFKVHLKTIEDQIKLEAWAVPKKGKSKNRKIGEFLVNPGAFSEGESKTEWYSNLYTSKKVDKKQKHKHLQIRLTFKYELSVVLPTDEYKEVALHLLANSCLMLRSTVRNTTTILPSTRAAFAKNLCQFVMGENKTEEVFQFILTDEVQETVLEKELFSVHSMAAKMVDLYLNQVGLSWVQNCLRPIFLPISKRITDAKFVPPGTPENGLPFFSSLIEEIMATIFGATEQCPLSIKKLFHFIYQEINLKFPPKKDSTKIGAVYSIIGGFLLVRLFLPVIEVPRMYDIVPVDELVEENVERTLLLTATVLRKLWQFDKFGNSEKTLQHLNPFLEQNYKNVVLFIDTIVNDAHPEEQWTDNPESVDYNGALARILKHVANEVQVLKATNQEKDSDSDLVPETTDQKNGKEKEKDGPKNKGELLEKFMLAFEKVSKESEESAEKQFSHRLTNLSTESSGLIKKNSLRNLRKGLSQRSLKAASMNATPESGRTPLLSEETSYASSDGEISIPDDPEKPDNKIRKSRKNDRRRTSTKDKKVTQITTKDKKSQALSPGENVGEKEEKT